MATASNITIKHITPRITLTDVKTKEEFVVRTASIDCMKVAPNIYQRKFGAKTAIRICECSYYLAETLDELLSKIEQVEQIDNEQVAVNQQFENGMVREYVPTEIEEVPNQYEDGWYSYEVTSEESYAIYIENDQVYNGERTYCPIGSVDTFLSTNGRLKNTLTRLVPYQKYPDGEYRVRIGGTEQFQTRYFKGDVSYMNERCTVRATTNCDIYTDIVRPEQILKG